jgi:2-C-methyl-D-erythritol 4-phosphate cytidylyltransferase
MVFGAILAGGSGSRMGNTETPKQYLTLGSKPILLHTIERFFVHPEIDRLLVLCPPSWTAHTQDMLKRFLPAGEEKIFVLEGGASRYQTLLRALDFIERSFPADAESVIVTHDAVRPFLTHRIISENVRHAKTFGACDTVIPATDTIVESADGKTIATIPSRKSMYQGQTPQSFNVQKLRRMCNGLGPEEQAKLTDACMIFSLKNEPVSLVEGEHFNIKITYPYDLQVARVLLEGLDKA